jgi:tetratricopeptide (TPR) repeat protein
VTVASAPQVAPPARAPAARNRKAVASAAKPSPKPAASDKDALIQELASRYSAKNWLAVIDTANAVLRIDPQLPQVLAERATAYAMTGDSEAAIRDSDRAIYLSSKTAAAFHAKSLALARKGETQEALDLDEQACRLGMQVVCADASK